MFHRQDSTIQEELLHCNVSGKEEGVSLVLSKRAGRAGLGFAGPRCSTAAVQADIAKISTEEEEEQKGEAQEINMYTQVESREEGWSGWTLEPGGLDTESLTGVILEEAEAAIWLEKTRAELSPVENEKWNRDSWRVVRP
nr:hypothetical protein Iba_chr11aCG13520 [Ipomoea batatas]